MMLVPFRSGLQLVTDQSLPVMDSCDGRVPVATASEESEIWPH